MAIILAITRRARREHSGLGVDGFETQNRYIETKLKDLEKKEMDESACS